MATRTLVSLQEFERLAADGNFHELDEGEVISMPPAGEEHGGIEENISYFISHHARQRRLGRVYTSDTGFVLSDHPPVVRSPDVAFVRAERVTRSKGFFRGAPDLAVEVVSPSDTAAQVRRRVRQYLAAGCAVVWVVFPDDEEMEVHSANGGVTTLRGDDPVECPSLLPGYSVPLSRFFE